MALELKQSLKMSQQLVMTPQLQQAIKLLQLNHMELADLVSQEMVEKTMKEAVQKRPEVKVLIRADKETKHLYVANVLSICKFVGVKETHIMVKTLN